METIFKSSARIRLFLALILIPPAMAYLFIASFGHVPEANQNTVSTIVGFILGSILGSIATYYWGSSQGSADKNKPSAES